MLSATAQQFLNSYVDSAELLDILMVLLNEPDGVWTCDALSARIFTVPQAAQKRVEELVERGLAEEVTSRPGSYRLRNLDQQTKSGLDALADAYRTNRAEVVGVVFARRQDPLSSFANAFKLRSDK